jgi:hypothetical protein
MIDNGQLDKTLKLDFPKAAGGDWLETLLCGHPNRWHRQTGLNTLQSINHNTTNSTKK